MLQMNLPTLAILLKYGISPKPNPPQVTSGNALVRNINSSTVNNLVNNKIIIILPLIPIAQPNIQIKNDLGAGLRNWISNQFRALLQKYLEESNFYKKYGERITEGVSKITRTITDATERFAENMNPQKLSRTMTDSKKIILYTALAILATKFIGPISKRIDKLYTWFVGDGKENKGFVEKFKEIFFPNKDGGIFDNLKKGVSYGFSLIKGYIKLALDDRSRALTELRTLDLDNVDLFDISSVPILIAKVFAALIGGSKGLSFIKTYTAGRKLKNSIIEGYKGWRSDLKNDFDQLGNVKNELNSAYRVLKRIEQLLLLPFLKKNAFYISTPIILSLLEALSDAVFTCYLVDGKLVRGTVINNARNFLSLLGYYDDEIDQLFKKNYVVEIKSIVIDKNNFKNVSGNLVITKEGWELLAFYYGAKKISVSDKNYWNTFELRLLEKWKKYWKEKLKGNKEALEKVDSVTEAIDPSEGSYKDEVKDLKRSWKFSEELEAARAADEEVFLHEYREELDFFSNLGSGIFGDEEEDLKDIDSFNERNYTESSSESGFNTAAAARAVHALSYRRFDKYDRVLGHKNPEEYTKHCAKHVRKAIQAGGVSLKGNPVDAYLYMSFLPKKGFKLIHSGRKNDLKNPDIYPWPDDLKLGDVVVFDRTDKHRSGHIALFDGRTWYSDYRQKTWHGLGDRNFDKFGVFRFDKVSQSTETTNSDGEELKDSPEVTSNEKVDVQSRMENMFKLFRPGKKKLQSTETTTPVTTEASQSVSSIEDKNTGVPSNKQQLSKEPTNKPPQPVSNTTEKQDNSTKTDEQNNNRKNNTETATYVKRGSVREVVLHHIMRASYTNGVKKDK